VQIIELGIDTIPAVVGIRKNTDTFRIQLDQAEI